MELTPIKIQATHEVLSLLSTKDKEKSFEFSSGTRIRMGMNISRLKDVLTKIMEQQEAIIKKHGTATASDAEKFEVAKDSPQWGEFVADMKKFMEDKFPVDIQTITGAELANKRKVKSRDEKGLVSENEVENQVPIDLIAELISAGILKAD